MKQPREALTANDIINLTQQVGKCGATRVHELQGETLTIFKDEELFEFAQKIADLQLSAAREALASATPAQAEPSGEALEELRQGLNWLHESLKPLFRKVGPMDAYTPICAMERVQGKFAALVAALATPASQTPAEGASLQRTAIGWQERAEKAEAALATATRWALAAGVPPEKLATTEQQAAALPVGTGELIGYISESTLAQLRDPEWKAVRANAANLWTTDAPPSRAIIPVYLATQAPEAAPQPTATPSPSALPPKALEHVHDLDECGVCDCGYIEDGT